MDISLSEYKHCDLVKASGRIDSETAPELAAAFEQIIEDGRFKIVFDMEDVDFISSAGLRVMINTQKTCKRFNRGELILANVPPNIYDAMDLVGFVPLFKFFDSTVDAVGHF
jgi:anti-sigma B factor antagonist